MKKKISLIFSAFLLFSLILQAQKYDGLSPTLSNLSKLSDAKTRSISPENFSGGKGKGGMADIKDKDKRNVANAAFQASDLGTGWKVNPFININPNETFTIAEMEGPGAIQHIWMTPTGNWQFSIIRIYWDDETTPSVEAPIGAFFGMGWDEYAPLNSLAVTVNPGSAFNCFWKMPFRKKCKITVENINEKEPMRLYYQVDYALAEVGNDEGYFHAQYRRNNPTKGSLYTILDGVKGKGQYVGTYMGVSANNNGWWGEGELKFFMDGDKDYPTICGTGLEDYFLGSYNFENKKTKKFEEYSTAYAGLHQVISPDGLYKSEQRFGMYRWHIVDPIRFDQELKVTVQDLGWRTGGKYLPQHSDIITVAYWYQREPHTPFPKLPSREMIEIN